MSRKLLVEVSEHQLLLECVVMAYWTYVQSRAVWVLKNFQSLLECLLPQLQPFNGTNARSVVILDNASIHHAEGIVKLTQSTGALVQFLPPCSPDIMPIEELFSKIKLVLKMNEDVLSEEMDIETILLAAFCTITPDDCKNWITHAGYV